MRRKVACLVLFTCVFGAATAQAQRIEWIRAAFWDARYPTGWTDENLSVMYRDGLAAAGYEILNADQLKAWMEARIADGQYSVVVFCKDNYPDTVCEPLLNSVIRRYLNAGGKVVAFADIPFYNEGHPGFTRNNWGNNGAPRILGFNTSPTTGGVARNRNQAVTFTPAGTRWGLTQTWLSNRPANPTNPADLIVLATDNVGSAAAWMKPYIAGDTFRGFVRIWDVDITITNYPSVDEIIRVAEYSGPRASIPKPGNGATGMNMLLLEWSASDLAATQDVYLGTDGAAVAAADTSSPEYKGVKSITDKMHFEPVPIQAGTTYYWRIDQIDAGGAVYKGDVWSFTATPAAAWAPKPADGSAYIAPDVVLEWMAGLSVVNHDVYFGTDRAAVEAGAPETKKADKQMTLSYTPAGLEPGMTYYWRVDEVVGGVTTPGAVWSFAVRPVIAKVDPNMIGWWKMEDENPYTAVDYSGWEHHGTLTGNAQWVEGYAGEALSLDGIDDSVDCGAAAAFNFSGSVTIAAWVRTATTVGDAKIASNQNNSTGGYKLGINASKAEFEIRTAANASFLNRSVAGGTPLVPGAWYHVTGVYNQGQSIRTYINGKLDRELATTEVLGASNGVFRIGRESYSASYFLLGLLDDVRLYNRALSEEEVAEIVQGDPLVASDRQPARDTIVNILDATELSWSAGATAARHDVYFGANREAVQAGGTGSPGYQGRQDATSFDLTGRVAFGGGDYFWRVDEVEADGATIHAGDVWKFAVPGYVLIDDFERYTNDSPYQIFQTWLDGYGFPADEFFPEYRGNGTGATIGNDIWTTGTPYTTLAERNYVRGGWQALPLSYNNSDAGTNYHSETERVWTVPQDLKAGGVTDLTLWFKGRAVKFWAKPDGSYLMSSTSGDISGTNTDYFRFAYKQLTGDGSIVAKVNSLTETWNWSKGGVMIRETLAQDSMRAQMIATGERRSAFENRPATGVASLSVFSAVGARSLPVWVKLERNGDQFTGSYSTDGTNWVLQTNADGGGGSSPTPSPNPQTIAMGQSVYIGLCVTSNNTGTPAIAEFSDVVITGVVAGDWAVADIGAAGALNPANDPADLYVAIQDTSGAVDVVTWPDATILNEWTPWTIPLSEFTGVDLSAVEKIFVGVGDRDSPEPDGAGVVYLDDLQVVTPVQ